MTDLTDQQATPMTHIRRGTARRLGLRRRYAATWHPAGYCSRCDTVHHEIQLIDSVTGLVRDQYLRWVAPQRQA